MATQKFVSTLLLATLLAATACYGAERVVVRNQHGNPTSPGLPLWFFSAQCFFVTLAPSFEELGEAFRRAFRHRVVLFVSERGSNPRTHRDQTFPRR